MRVGLGKVPNLAHEKFVVILGGDEIGINIHAITLNNFPDPSYDLPDTKVWPSSFSQ